MLFWFPTTVKSPNKETPKCSQTPKLILKASKKGQPLYKGQSLYKGQKVHPKCTVVALNQALQKYSLGEPCLRLVLLYVSCVLRTYSKAQRVLEQYQHMPSFHGIQKDCVAIISQLKVLLRHKLEDPASSTSTVAETVDLLLELNEPAEVLCQQYLEK